MRRYSEILAWKAFLDNHLKVAQENYKNKCLLIDSLPEDIRGEKTTLARQDLQNHEDLIKAELQRVEEEAIKDIIQQALAASNAGIYREIILTHENIFIDYYRSKVHGPDSSVKFDKGILISCRYKTRYHPDNQSSSKKKILIYREALDPIVSYGKDPLLLTFKRFFDSLRTIMNQLGYNSGRFTWFCHFDPDENYITGRDDLDPTEGRTFFQLKS